MKVEWCPKNAKKFYVVVNNVSPDWFSQEIYCFPEFSVDDSLWMMVCHLHGEACNASKNDSRTCKLFSEFSRMKWASEKDSIHPYRIYYSDDPNQNKRVSPTINGLVYFLTFFSEAG